MKKQTIILLLTLITAVALCGSVSATDGTWNVETVNDSGDFSSMALDSNDNPHIAYFDPTSSIQGLKYVNKIGSTWSAPEMVDSSVTQGYLDIAIDPSNNPRISYYDSATGHTHVLKYAYKDGTGWHTQDLTSTADSGQYNSIAFDSSGNAHISYREMSTGPNDWNLMYIKQSGGSWNLPEVVHSEGPGGGSVGIDTSIALDSSGNPRISYYANFIGLTAYAYKDGTGWHHEYAHQQSDGYSNGDTSLALDSFGYPHISYNEWIDSSHDRLAYVFKDGSGWQTRQIVDSSSNQVGKFTSLALDTENNPHISYYDQTNEDLKYAYWTGTGWSITTIDSNSAVGKYTSIALDSAGNPHIGYIGSVKYASFVPNPQQQDAQSSTVNAASTSTVNAALNTVGMQTTGAPLTPLALSIFSVLGGLAATRKKQ